MGKGGGGGSKSQSQTTPDPTLQRINRIFANQLEGGLQFTGGLNTFLAPNYGMVLPNTAASQALAGMLARAGIDPRGVSFNLPAPFPGMVPGAVSPVGKEGAYDKKGTVMGGPAVSVSPSGGGGGGGAVVSVEDWLKRHGLTQSQMETQYGPQWWQYHNLVPVGPMRSAGMSGGDVDGVPLSMPTMFFDPRGIAAAPTPGAPKPVTPIPATSGSFRLGGAPWGMPGSAEMDARILSLMNPLEREAMTAMRSAADPAAVQRLFERITAPTITGTAAAGGFGRSGAALEALERGGVELTPQIMAAQQNLGRFAGALGQALDARDASRLQAAFDVAMLPQQAAFGEFLRPGQAIANLLGGSLMHPGQASVSSGKSVPKDDTMNQLMAAAGLAMMIFCWCADATLDPEDAAYARYYVNAIPEGFWKRLYRRHGPWLADLAKRHRTVRALLRPVFARLARKGRAALEG